MIPWLQSDTPFPALETALNEPNGLLAAGADLSPQRLIAAYRRGIFPWYSPGQPILWWSPEPRMVLFPHELKVSRSLAKRLRRGDFEIRADTAFRSVMEACATSPRPDQQGTWIVPELVTAYCQLHALGVAHSVETWIDGKLVGGLYGVSIGRMFFGESMFHHVTDASKIAFAHLVQYLVKQGVGMIDCQMQTPHLASLGAREIAREEFISNLTTLVDLPGHYEPWELHEQNS